MPSASLNIEKNTTDPHTIVTIRTLIAEEETHSVQLCKVTLRQKTDILRDDASAHTSPSTANPEPIRRENTYLLYWICTYSLVKIVFSVLTVDIGSGSEIASIRLMICPSSVI